MLPNIPSQTVLYTAEQAVKVYRRLCQQHLDQAEANLTVDQGLALMVLHRHPALSQQQLAELVFKDKASITRIIELLVQKALLTRIEHPTDRRKSTLQLTDQGQQALGQLRATIELNQQTALQGVSETDLAHCEATLRKLIANCTAAAD